MSIKPAVIFFLVFCFLSSRILILPLNTSILEEDKSEKGLIRLELLSNIKKEMKQPLRNIFLPYERMMEKNPKMKEEKDLLGPLGTEVSENNEDEAYLKILDLKYLGYVGTSHKKDALVTLRGESFSVQKGDELPGGIIVLRIDNEKIVFKSPQYGEFQILLQGEER